MLNSISKSTLDQYSPAITTWAKYCKLHKININSPNITDVIKHLTQRFHEGLSYGSLNSIRSALALIIGPHLGTDDKIKRLFRGFFRLRPPKPKYNSTWDVSTVLNYIENSYSQKDDLESITKKTVTLLMLATGQRAQTISLISINNIVINEDCVIIKIDKLIKTSGPNRMQPFLTLPFFNKNNICPAKAVISYLDLTKSIRNSNLLFISIRRPYKSVTPSTISRWVKKVMEESGIDISIFSAHSTRHASTSAAYSKGVNIDDIRRAAGWTGESTTFARFYKRHIINNRSFSEAIFNNN